MSRSPTAALAYITLFKKARPWSSTTKSEEYIKDAHPQTYPNSSPVELMLEDNKEFWQDQDDYYDVERNMMGKQMEEKLLGHLHRFV